MHLRLLIGGLVLVMPLTLAADPGDIVTAYGVGGRAVIDAVASNVGVGVVRADPTGRAVVTVALDPESGAAAVVSADGAAVATIELGGGATAGFGAAGAVYVAHDEGGAVIVGRYLADGSLDLTFGDGGHAVVPVEDAVRGDLIAQPSGVLVTGGVLGGPTTMAWAARFDSTGQIDSGFGDQGVVILIQDNSGDVDLHLAKNVHAVDGGYLSIVLSRALEGDAVNVVHFDAGGVIESEVFTFPGGLFSAESHSLADGSVFVVVQTTDEDVDTFHMRKFRPDGTLDRLFTGATLTDDEVGGRVHLTQLRTGSIALAYNTGPDASFVVRLLDPDGSDGGTMDIDLGEAWIYGMASVDHDGSLILAVDETPASSIEPDDLALVKVTGDESGRFIDDDASVHEDDIEELAGRGVTRGCDPPRNVNFCPDDPVTRGQMAAFLVRALGLGASEVDAFVDDGGSVFEGDIDRLAAAGITRGCNPPVNDRYCPDDPVTRAQMASLLVRALPGG